MAMALAAGLLLASCSREQRPAPQATVSEFQKQLQWQLINAKPGDVITIPGGVYAINRGLSLNVFGVTLRGLGMDMSVLSFTGQVQGAEELLRRRVLRRAVEKRRGAQQSRGFNVAGIVINSSDRVEIFDNVIADNDTANIIISSYCATGYPGTREVADDYDPYPETVFV